MYRRLSLKERWYYDWNYKYVTMEEYKVMWNNKVIIIPERFLSDGATGGPDFGTSWLVHDYLYCTHKFTSGEECTREEADQVMSYLMENEHLIFYRRILLWFSKRLLCQCVLDRAWNKSGERGPEFFNPI